MNNESNTITKKTTTPRYLVMDIVFYAGTLNYDQGAGNYQELKKITQWDGTVRIQVSRYALRYSILSMANNNNPEEWKLAGKDELTVKSKVVQKKKETDTLAFAEFDLFGYLIATAGENDEAGEQEARVSPVKITHATSLNSYNFDSHFTANLGMMRRAGEKGSNPVNMEEFKGFYIYNITLDIERIGKLDTSDNDKTHEKKESRIRQLLETIMYLKRDIKGKREDLSPWLVVAGIYENMNYDTYIDRIELLKSKKHSIMREESKRQEGDKAIIEVTHHEQSDNAFKPKFRIYELQKDKIKIFKRSDIELDTGNTETNEMKAGAEPKQENEKTHNISISDKKTFLEGLYTALNIQEEKPSDATNTQG